VLALDTGPVRASGMGEKPKTGGITYKGDRSAWQRATQDAARRSAAKKANKTRVGHTNRGDGGRAVDEFLGGLIFDSGSR
jgi:hypothetical protein